jgi:DNA adenine methylase
MAMADRTSLDLANGSAVPLLKWPGGKRALLSQIEPLIPRIYGRYFEPFLGGAALFFHLRPHAATLSDANAELVECYEQVRDRPDLVLRYLRTWPNGKRQYNRLRRTVFKSPARRAARFIYLTTLAFNGIYRVNRRGQFNVPYGGKRHINVASSTPLAIVSEALRGSTILCTDFEEAVRPASPGDLVYLDPPYTVAHGSNGFRKYNARIFSWTDQVRLATVARALAERGCHVIISNASHVSIHQLYPDFRRTVITRPSRVAADPSGRGPVQELIISSIGRM